MPPTSSDDPIADDLIQKARICIGAGMQPSEYDALDDDTRNAFVEVLEDIKQQHRK